MYDPMYHPQHHEPPQPPQGNGYAHAPPPPNAMEDAAHTPSASNLDHALLESLFYNEMVTFEPSAGQVALPTEHDTPHTIVEKEILRDFGVGGTTLFEPAPPEYNGHATSVAAAPQHPATSSPPVSGYATGVLPQPVAPMQQQQQQQQQSLHHQHQHPVSNPPLHHQATAAPPPPPQYANPVGTPTYALPVGNASAPPPTTSTPVVSNGTTLLAAPGQPPQPQPPQQQHPTQMVYMDTQATATAAAAAAAMLSGGGTTTNSNSNGGGMKVPGMASPNTTLKTASMTTTYATNPAAAAAPNGILPTQQPPPQHAQPPHAQQQASPVQVPEQKARQLVDQFATLASRLGIDLPDSVLKSLTSAAAKNDPSLLNRAAPAAAAATTTAATPPTVATSATPTTTPSTTTATAATATTIPTRTVASNSVAKSSKGTVPPPKGGSGGTTELTAMAPTVMQLRNMAEEAIAAVTQSGMKRTASTEMLSKTASSQARPATSNGNSNDHKPTYSKRRKKPRLSDCEARLTQLKAENEQLKRHLQNVSNKAHKFDKEKEEAGKQIARLMHDPNAGPREMEQSVRKFSDMYSDYGINRQQELSFHLEQLQRLVNPTNFTKMGLWTLGQSNQGTIKKNPIAGILVKELDITPQQGRKILDQSEKIRKLCDNLKEAHALLVKLKYLCEKKTRCFQDRMNKCTEILTSKQVVKLICWINENTALLENVCPGWGTEHIQPKK